MQTLAGALEAIGREVIPAMARVATTWVGTNPGRASHSLVSAFEVGDGKSTLDQRDR